MYFGLPSGGERVCQPTLDYIPEDLFSNFVTCVQPIHPQLRGKNLLKLLSSSYN